MKILNLFIGEISPGFQRTKLFSMTSAATENDKTVRTKIVAATFGNDFGSVEVSGEKAGRILVTLIQENQIIGFDGKSYFFCFI